MVDVWEHSPLRGSRLLLLLAIADYANDDRTAWPSIASLAKKCRTNKRVVIRLLNDLEKAGQLILVERGGPTKSNRYKIPNAQQLKQLPDKEWCPIGHQGSDLEVTRVVSYRSPGVVSYRSPEPSYITTNITTNESPPSAAAPAKESASRLSEPDATANASGNTDILAESSHSEPTQKRPARLSDKRLNAMPDTDTIVNTDASAPEAFPPPAKKERKQSAAQLQHVLICDAITDCMVKSKYDQPVRQYNGIIATIAKRMRADPWWTPERIRSTYGHMDSYYWWNHPHGRFGPVTPEIIMSTMDTYRKALDGT